MLEFHAIFFFMGMSHKIIIIVLCFVVGELVDGVNGHMEEEEEEEEEQVSAV